jgi:prolyl-tRNA editing enzyme YbaK/EbsC (Cys-tRNA(Pro) deacylase)
MSIPSRLSSYLDQRGARYEICAHEPSRSSAETARAAHVLPHQLAKSVILVLGRKELLNVSQYLCTQLDRFDDFKLCTETEQLPRALLD